MGLSFTHSVAVLCDEKKELSGSLVGMRSLRYASKAETTAELAATVLSVFGEEFKLNTSALILGTTTPDQGSPATAHKALALVEHSVNIAALDVASSCSSYISALTCGRGWLRDTKKVCVVSAERKHPHVQKADPRVQNLFADGAAGSLIANDNLPFNFEVEHFKTRSELLNNIGVKRIDGTETLELLEPRRMYREIVREMEEAILSLWDKRVFALNALGLKDDKTPGYVFVHQANPKLLLEVRDRLPEHIASRMPILMRDIGNSVSASLGTLRVRVLQLYAQSCGLKIERTTTEFGALHTTQIGGEVVSLLDMFTLDSDVTWQSTACPEELTITQNCIEVQKKATSRLSIDLWIAAGGGFQTLGALHTRRV